MFLGGETRPVGSGEERPSREEELRRELDEITGLFRTHVSRGNYEVAVQHLRRNVDDRRFDELVRGEALRLFRGGGYERPLGLLRAAYEGEELSSVLLGVVQELFRDGLYEIAVRLLDGNFDDAVISRVVSEEEVRLFASGDYERDITFLVTAYPELRLNDENSSDVTFSHPGFLESIARCNFRLGHWCDADRYYRYYLRQICAGGRSIPLGTGDSYNVDQFCMTGDVPSEVEENISSAVEGCRRRNDSIDDVLGATTEDSSDASQGPFSRRAYDISFWTLLGISLALGIAGSVCWGLSYRHAGERDELIPTSDQSVLDEAWEHEYARQDLATAGDVMIPISGASLAAGLVVFIVGRVLGHRARANESSVRAMFSGQGLVLEF